MRRGAACCGHLTAAAAAAAAASAVMTTQHDALNGTRSSHHVREEFSIIRSFGCHNKTLLH